MLVFSCLFKYNENAYILVISVLLVSMQKEAVFGNMNLSALLSAVIYTNWYGCIVLNRVNDSAENLLVRCVLRFFYWGKTRTLFSKMT